MGRIFPYYGLHVEGLRLKVRAGSSIQKMRFLKQQIPNLVYQTLNLKLSTFNNFIIISFQHKIIGQK